VDRRTKVELFEGLRREYEFGVGSVQGVAKKFGVHRRLVRQALESALPPERKVMQRSCPALDPVRSFIDAILLADKQAPRKQRHTAHRVWVRLCEELPQHPVAESTIRAYVRERKAAIGLSSADQDVHVPQDYAWGEEAQVDWYEAYALLGDLGDGRLVERVKVQIFSMRSMKSGAAYHRAYRHATQQAFFDAHAHAFAFFGGVFHTLRYDNLGSAVKRIVRGYTREEHTRFIAFRSHWKFTAEFCNPAQPQEKGGVEGEVGRFRRNHLVPVPEASDLAALNRKLYADCEADLSRRVGDRSESAGQMLLGERQHLLPIPTETFDLAVPQACLVDARGCVKTHRVWYSTPLRAGTKVQVRALPSSIEVWHGGKRVALHERSYVRDTQVLDLEHYLEALHRKPGAFAGSRPLAQWRAQGLWPSGLDQLWRLWQERQGKQAGTRELVNLLLLGVPEYGWGALAAAAETALTLGCTDASAVKCLLAQSRVSQVANGARAAAAAVAPLSGEDLGSLSRYDRPLPEMSGYDQLLQAGAL
jgi:transposase